MFYCSYCRLPENHACPNFNKGNVFNKLRPEKTEDRTEVVPYNIHKHKPRSVLKWVALVLLVLVVVIYPQQTQNLIYTGINTISNFFSTTPTSTYTPLSALTPTPAKEVQRCNDNTLYNRCSENNPLYCDNGKLVNKASVCGCPAFMSVNGDICLSMFETNPKKIKMQYTLDGNTWQLDYTAFGGLKDFLAGLPRYFVCDPSCPTRAQQEATVFNEEHEQAYIQSIVKFIQEQTTNKDDQARIAISLVQNIPYDWSGFNTGRLNGRYPYEVLYDNKGVCGEKSKLLAILLRDLGFGVVLFDYTGQSHQAVGIKCTAHSLENSGYCFIESTQPSIITDDSGDYVKTGKLGSPDILPVSDGLSFDASQEFKDAQEFQRINSRGGGVVDTYTYSQWMDIVDKYGIKTGGN